MQAGAAATLSGLVFVAISLNINRILSSPGLAGRAAESMLQFLGVFWIACAALIPRQPHQAFAIEVLAISALLWFAQSIGHIRYFRKRLPSEPWTWFFMRTIMSQIAAVPCFVAGVLLVNGVSDGMYWLAAGFGLSFLSAGLSAWVLLVEILR